MGKRTDLQQKIIEKAMKDEAFKKELKANPKEALKKEFNIDVPEGIEINVLEETEKQFYITIPSAEEEKSTADIMW